MLCVDNKFLVAVLLCNQRSRKVGEFYWLIRPHLHERGYITLLGLFNRDHDGVVGYHLFSELPLRYLCTENDPWLQTGVQLAKLSDFYPLAAELWARTKRHSSDFLSASKAKLCPSAPA